MANKKQFPKDFTKKTQVNATDKILGADAVSGDPYFIEVGEITKNKVDKENNKSLVLDSEITKLQGLLTKTQLDATINSGLNTKVDKVTGKGLSSNDYTTTEKDKVAKIKVEATGDGNKFLNEKGEYKEVIVPKAPVQSVSVNGNDVAPDVDGNVAITIPSAPVQSIDVNGENVAPDVNGKVSIQIPDAPVQSISLNNASVEPDVNGNVNIKVVQNVEQTINPASTDPVSSSAVASAFNELDSKYGTQLSLSTIGDGDDKVYSISLINEHGDILSTTEEFSGGGGSGEVTTTKIVLTKLSQNSTIKKGDEVILQYQYDHLDTTTNESTGNPATIVATVTAGANSVTRESVVNAGTINSIDCTELLQLGNNLIRIRAEVNTGDRVQVATITYTILVVNLVLNSSLDYAQTFDKGTPIYVPFSLQGAGNKTLKTYVNGSLYETRTITQSTATGTVQIPTSSYSHGNVSVQIVAELDVVSSTILSNSIYYDLIIRESNNNTPVIASKYTYVDGRIIEAGQKPVIVAKQFEEFTIIYAVFDPLKPTKLVNVYIDDNIIASANVGFSQQKTVYKTLTSGEFSGRIVTGSKTYNFDIDIQSSNVNLQEPTDNLAFKFTASGKSNNDVNKGVWNSTVNNVTATLTGVKYGGDGWMNNALRLSDDGRATVNYNVLSASNSIVNNSFTYQIKFKVSEVTNDDAQVIKCVDSEGTGFVITTNEAKMVTKGKATVSMKLASGEIYNVAFVSYPLSNNDSSEHEKLNDSMLYLYINGILSGAVQKANTDSIYQATPTTLTFGANGASLDVYNTRLYNRYLNDSEVLDLSIVDLDSVTEIVDKYNANAIIDNNGDITVDSIAKDMRYIIITGVEANGVPTVLQAAVNNNKKTKYNVTEILHIKKSEPQLNFKLVGGSIQLQGTSSLAYPIKNYKITLKNSQKVDGEFYLGCDAQGNGGVLQDKALFSFKVKSDNGKVPAPVNLWCLKADFAESSSSHNTGMSRLVHNTLTSIGEKTPPQKAVPNDYKYDVRTTVDGEPCYLFYRATVNDVPKFLGKYNMNNDKGTEAVFGFLNIPNYHLEADGVTPTQWIQTKFGGKNPTECWEFLNNDYPMGSYLDDDFNAMVDVDGKQIPNWTRVFEARFPDNQDDYADGTKKPYYLERFVKWVKNTQSNTTKFKAELKDYADVSYLCDYYVFTDLMGAVDQRVKNQMLAFWYDTAKDKMLGYFIFYDNDTILGVRNDGRLKYNFDIDEDSTDSELSIGGNTVYAFAGHNSVLWKNLRTEFQTELQEAYQRIRTKMTNDYIFNMFDKEQSDKYVERVYNIDAQYKYVKPKTLGVDVNVGGVVTNLKYSYLEASQGSRKSHRHWWLTNRLNLFDAKYSTGQFTLTDIAWKGYSNAGATIKATANRDFYFQVRRESTIMTHAKVLKNVEWSYSYPQTANIGTIFHLYGGVFMSKLNMSEWGGFTDLNLPNLPVLETLILGGASGKTYSLTELVIADKMPMLKFLDMRNYSLIPSIDLSACNRLEELNALGCNTLTSIALPNGSPISKLTLPKNLKTLKLTNFNKISNSNISFPDGVNVETLIYDNCPLINWETLYNTMSTTVKNLRATGIKKTGTADWLLQFMNVGGVTENGTLTTTCSLVGTYQLTKFVSDSLYSQLVAHFPELSISQPNMSVVKFNTNVADPKNITNIDNNTGYGTGTEYIANGHVTKILDKRFRCLGKQTSLGNMLITPLDNNDSRLFKNKQDATAYQNGSHGDVYVYEPHYWYKGVNDYKNNANYACYSSNAEKPKAYDGKTLILPKETFTTVAGRENAPIPVSYRENTRLYNTTQYSTLNDFLNPQSGYFVYGMNVEGYKQIRFPAITSDTIISAIVATGPELTSQVLGTGLKISGLNVMFTNGMYYVMDIPTNAKWVFITFTTTDTFDKVVLTDSTSIYDVEPDWIEHKEALVSAFDVSYFIDAQGETILKSFPSMKQVVSNLTFETYSNYVGDLGRKLQLPDYEEMKNITNLFYAKYGNRNSQLQCGYGQNSFTRSGTGSTIRFGMNDSAVNTASGNLEYCVFSVKNSDGTTSKIVNNEINCMGYEDLYGGVNEWISGIITAGNYTVAVENSDKVTRYLQGYRAQNGNYMQGVHFGKYMDIYPCGSTTGATDSTHYCDTINVGTGNTVGNVFNRGGQSGQSRVDAGITALVGIYNSTQNISTVTTRLMFKGGNIVITENVTTFINANEIA